MAATVRPEEGRMHRIRWMIVGALGLLAVQRYRKTGTFSMDLRGALAQARTWMAELVDRKGHTLGELVTGRSHALSERLRTNGQAKRIPVNGGEG